MVLFFLSKGYIINMDELKGNSFASREQKDSKKEKIEPVTTNVTVKKPKNKLLSKFFAEDAKTVCGHVLNVVVIPSLQKLFSDVIKGAVDWLIYGSKGSQPKTGVSNVSYSRYYSSNAQPQTAFGANPMLNRSNVFAVQDVMFNERADAEEVLLRMAELVEKYGMVSVADFYELVGQRFAFTDQKYGWRDLRTAEIVRGISGFYIIFPKAIELQ